MKGNSDFDEDDEEHEIENEGLEVAEENCGISDTNNNN